MVKKVKVSLDHPSSTCVCGRGLASPAATATRLKGIKLNWSARVINPEKCYAE